MSVIKNSIKKARVTNPVTGVIKKSAKGNELRSFILYSVNGNIVNNTEPANYFFSTTPSASANKIFNSWCKKNKLDGNAEAEIEIRESTRNSKKKNYVYKCQRNELDKIDNVDRDGVNIMIKYKTKCMSIKNDN